MITEQHKEALAAIKELKGEKIGASMILELVELVETLDANLYAFAEKAGDIARAADAQAAQLAAVSAAYRRQRDELETVHANLAHYQSALCMPDAPEYQVQHGGVVPDISPVRVAELVDQLAAIRAESAAMAIPEGWALSSADFSIIAQGGNRPGSVALVRSGEDRANWHRFADANAVGLYVFGRGKSYSEALIEAIKEARAAAPVPKGGA